MMKFIDSKGKLFGKINIIDLMVVLGIILVIVVGVKFLMMEKTDMKIYSRNEMLMRKHRHA